MQIRGAMPGFTAIAGLESKESCGQYARVDGVVSAQAVVPCRTKGNSGPPERKSEFACGIGLALVLGGIADANPFAVLGGIVLVGRSC